MKKLLFILITLLAFSANAQKIELNENKYFINGEQVPTYEVKKLMKDKDYTAYANFKAYNNKSSWGGFLIGFGGAMIIGDVVKSLVSNEDFPGGMSAVGAAALIASYPVLKGRTKKLNKAIETYNQAVSEDTLQGSNFNPELNFVANGRGFGFQLNF